MSNLASPSHRDPVLNTDLKRPVLVISTPDTETSLVDRLQNQYQLSCASSTEEGLLLLSQLKQQIVLIESSMITPTLQDELFQSEHKVILLSPTPSFEHGIEAIQQGYKGYGNLHSHRDRLNAAINLVLAGDVWLGASIVEGLKASAKPKKSALDTSNQLELLTPKEIQVAKQLTSGKSNKDIAIALSMSERTVKAHLSSIYQKLSLKNRTELLLKYNNAF